MKNSSGCALRAGVCRPGSIDLQPHSLRRCGAWRHWVFWCVWWAPQRPPRIRPTRSANFAAHRCGVWKPTATLMYARRDALGSRRPWGAGLHGDFVNSSPLGRECGGALSGTQVEFASGSFPATPWQWRRTLDANRCGLCHRPPAAGFVCPWLASIILAGFSVVELEFILFAALLDKLWRATAGRAARRTTWRSGRKHVSSHGR